MTGMILDGVLMLLLVAALGYGVRLEKKLSALRAGEQAFASAVTELNAAAGRAEAALANLHRPGAATGTLVTALGFGLDYTGERVSLDGQRVKPYTVFDLSWQTQWRDWKFQANIKNLFDKVYAQNSINQPRAGFPSAFIGIFFTGSLLVEVIFSLDGLGLMSFEAAINRDYPVVFGTLFIFTLLGLVVKLIGDITYTLVDPRIDFESREG